MAKINRILQKPTFFKTDIRAGLFVALAIVTFCQISPASGKTPAWVKKRPVSKFYYIGIGSAPKNNLSSDYTQSAKSNALNDLASEITVKITSKFLYVAVEQYGIATDEVRSEILSSTEANLEGFELVDSWENDNEYWVYYRLSRDLYHQQEQLKLQKAIDLSLNLFRKGKVSEERKDISSALSFYLQSLAPIKSYVHEPLEINYQGSKIFLLNEIFSSIHSLLNHIELEPTPEKQEAQTGRPLKTPLTVIAIYSDESGETTHIANLPLHFAFGRGAGDLVEKNQTNMRGKAACRVSKIISTDRIQLVTARVDVFSLLGNESKSGIFASTLEALPIPGTRFILNVSGRTVFIQASETNLGRKLSILHIEPILKNSLSDYGFTYVDEMSKADIFIELKAASRSGSEMYGMYTSYADVTISVTDMATGVELYKNALQDIKGIQLNYRQAGFKAMENASKKIKEEMLPALLEQIQK